MVSGLVGLPKLEEPALELVVREEPRGLSSAGGLREEEDAVAAIASGLWEWKWERLFKVFRNLNGKNAQSMCRALLAFARATKGGRMRVGRGCKQASR
jgi:hypothetical protein